jgi:hypothetical protein
LRSSRVGGGSGGSLVGEGSGGSNADDATMQGSRVQEQEREIEI